MNKYRIYFHPTWIWFFWVYWGGVYYFVSLDTPGATKGDFVILWIIRMILFAASPIFFSFNLKSIISIFTKKQHFFTIDGNEITIPLPYCRILSFNFKKTFKISTNKISKVVLREHWFAFFRLRFITFVYIESSGEYNFSLNRAYLYRADVQYENLRNYICANFLTETVITKR